jgi:adenylate cyclase
MNPKEKPAPPRPPHTERRLAAILHADAYGYSRLINEDESGTLRVLTPALALLRDLVQQYGGSSVGSRGDSLLAEFPSVVAAVQCAIEMQHELQTHNTDLPENKRIAFRIGISLGEIVIDGDQPHGDGINIAVRIEGLAEPGEICLSEIAYQQVKNKLSLQYEDLGPQQLKNIPEPVRVYRIILNEAAWAVVEAARQTRRQIQQVRTPRHSRVVFVSVFVSVLLLGGIAGVRYLSFPVPSPQSLAPTQFPTPNPQPLPLPDKPSIVVLPFTNMSNDPAQEYFSDGLTEDLTSALSRLSGLFVLSRNTAFFYKGKAVKMPELSKELGVQYVLEGSVRKADERVRITAQLIDATQDRHLWSERYDRSLEDIFALQDEIVQQIGAALRVEVLEAELERVRRIPTDNLTAYDTLLRGLELSIRAFSTMNKDANARARQLFERAIELDPRYAQAYARLSHTYWLEWWYGWNPTPQTLERLGELAQQAITLDESLPEAHFFMANFYLWQKQHERAIAEAERAIALDPNGAEWYMALGAILGAAGRPEEGITMVERAMRLNPRFPVGYLTSLGLAYRVAGRYEEAIATAKQMLARQPNFPPAYFVLAFSYAQLDRLEEAKAAGAELQRLFPLFSLERWKQMAPFKDPALVERDLAALRKAGLK